MGESIEMAVIRDCKKGYFRAGRVSGFYIFVRYRAEYVILNKGMCSTKGVWKNGVYKIGTGPVL